MGGGGVIVWVADVIDDDGRRTAAVATTEERARALATVGLAVWDDYSPGDRACISATPWEVDSVVAPGKRVDLAAEPVEIPAEVTADGPLRRGDVPGPGPAGEGGAADLEGAGRVPGADQSGVGHGASVASPRSRKQLDRDDIPAGVEPEEIEDYQEWVDYWNGLSDEDRAFELRAMADYAEYTRGES